MNINEFIEEARQLVRPCVYLTPNNSGASLAAVWGGPGLISHSSGKSSLRHLFSLDCCFLPESYELLTGCLSVYVDEGEDFDEWGEHGTVAINPSMQLTESHTSGVELFAHSSSSWPPVDAVLRLGSPAVKEWVRECGWQPEWLYDHSFKGRDIVDSYEEHVREHNPNPLFSADMDDIFARLGGWHESWPEDDWCELPEKKLVAFTYKDAEPWFEVWVDDQQNFQVINRIT